MQPPTATSSNRMPSPPCFNPHPARRPDATPVIRGVPRSMKSSSSQKAGCNVSTDAYVRDLVSILIQPEGRMQPGIAFPSSCRMTLRDLPIRCFNPHPARRPDATSKSVNGSSIGIREINPAVRLQSITSPTFSYSWFQSSSSQKAGCNSSRAAVRYASPGAVEVFQSSSSQKAGCNTGSARTSVALAGLGNPHPARRPDATV